MYMFFFFFQPVACEGQIETWLSSFVTSLKSSLQFQMATALGYEKPKPKRRTIRSAGSRKVSIPARASSSLSKQNKGDNDDDDDDDDDDLDISMLLNTIYVDYIIRNAFPY